MLAHGLFTGQGGKTARGIYRYAAFPVQAILDHRLAGRNAADIFPGCRSVPIVSRLTEVTASYNTLIVGVSPIGGMLLPDWRRDIRCAVRRGKRVISGLHQFISEDKEFVSLARQSGARLIDLRRADPACYRILTGGVPAEKVVLVAGTDCSAGKMVTTVELTRSLRQQGVNAGYVATGQTGLFCGADRGLVIDRLPGDFMAGVTEQLVSDTCRERDIVLVEGQGALHHPAYSGVALAIMHGAQPGKIILCHHPQRKSPHDFPLFAIPPLLRVIADTERLAEPVSRARVMGLAIIGEGMAASELTEYVAALRKELKLPVTDVRRLGTAPLEKALLGS